MPLARQKGQTSQLRTDILCQPLPQRLNPATTSARLLVTQLPAKPGQCNQNSLSPASTESNHQRKAQAWNALERQASVQLTKGVGLLARSGPHEVATTTYAGADEHNGAARPYLALEGLLCRGIPTP